MKQMCKAGIHNWFSFRGTQVFTSFKILQSPFVSHYLLPRKVLFELYIFVPLILSCIYLLLVSWQWGIQILSYLEKNSFISYLKTIFSSENCRKPTVFTIYGSKTSIHSPHLENRKRLQKAWEEVHVEMMRKTVRANHNNVMMWTRSSQIRQKNCAVWAERVCNPFGFLTRKCHRNSPVRCKNDAIATQQNRGSLHRAQSQKPPEEVFKGIVVIEPERGIYDLRFQRDTNAGGALLSNILISSHKWIDFKAVGGSQDAS